MISAIFSPKFRKHLLCVCVVILVIGIFLMSQPTKNNTYTFLLSNEPYEILDIMDDSDPPIGSIFFIDSTQNLGMEEVTDVSINFRKACSVESTAKAHTNLSIYILYTTPIKHPDSSLLDEPEYAALKQIYVLPNVRIRSLNVTRFVKDTPVESLFTSGKFNTSVHPSVHLSDILRLVVLWRYGGTYLDIDVVVTKSLYNLGKNYCVLESYEFENKLNNAQISLENKGIGRKIMEACMVDLASSFNGYGWAENGPYLLTRVVTKVCGMNVSSIQTDDDCGGLKIHPYWFFNPYDWGHYPQPFNPAHTAEGLENMKRSYAIHVYGHSTKDMKIYKNNSFVLYAELAKKYCPGSYYNSGDYF